MYTLIEREKATGYSVSGIRSMRVQTPARGGRLPQSAGKENNAYYIKLTTEQVVTCGLDCLYRYEPSLLYFDCLVLTEVFVCVMCFSAAEILH